MEVRIEIQVDADVPHHRVEEFRKSLEDGAWAIAGTWRNAAGNIRVQANEVNPHAS